MRDAEPAEIILSLCRQIIHSLALLLLLSQRDIPDYRRLGIKLEQHIIGLPPVPAGRHSGNPVHILPVFRMFYNTVALVVIRTVPGRRIVIGIPACRRPVNSLDLVGRRA